MFTWRTTPVDRPASPPLYAGYCPPEGDGAPMMVLELMKYGDLQSFLQANMYVNPLSSKAVYYYYICLMCDMLRVKHI